MSMENIEYLRQRRQLGVREASFSGIGLHSGCAASVRIRPLSAGSGISFCRVDLKGMPRVDADADRVRSGALATELVGANGFSVSTVEHLMAALVALSIRDALILVDGPELPVMDGSAAPFIEGLRAAGWGRRQASGLGLPPICLQRPVEVRIGQSWMVAEPSNSAFSLDITVDYPGLGAMRGIYDGGEAAIALRMADARTFAFAADLESIRARGLARGGSLDNAVLLLADGTAMNPSGMRGADEPLRHKALDVLGDLAMLGAPLMAKVRTVRPGHQLTNALARAISFAQHPNEARRASA